MRKGKGELTYHQLKVINKDLQRQIRNLTAERDKLQHDYDSLKIAHKKLLEESRTGEKPQQKKIQVSSEYGRIGFVGIPPAMGFAGHNIGRK